MWRCTRCGRQFAHENQWHACTDLTVAEHLSDKTEHAVALYENLVGAIAGLGDVRVHPTKTRIAFINRMSFAGCRLRKRHLVMGLILPGPVDSDRFTKLEVYGPNSFAHTINITEAWEIDTELLGWLGDAFQRGLQESESDARPIPVGMLAKTTCPFRGRVQEGGTRVAIPAYVETALSQAVELQARILGATFQPDLVREGTGTVIRVPGFVESAIRWRKTVDVVMGAVL